MRKDDFWSWRLLALLSIAAVVLAAGCSVNVKKEKSGQDKDVDIRTPLGAIHVSKGANPEDVGVPVYPGAHLKEKDSDGSDKSANVNISGFGFGLKVVALEYESNESPDKIVSYYKDQLKKYGNVLVCHTSHLNIDRHPTRHDRESHELTCGDSSGSNIELKVGTDENQHIVAVEPQGSGSKFSLVYVRTHGKDADI